MGEKRFSPDKALPVATAVLIFALAYLSPVANTGSDPQFGLLVSQTMLRHQTVQMDIYRETIAPILERAFVTIDGHIYYYFPLGTPIFSLPAVGVANLLGYDMADAVQEAAVQNFLSAVLAGLSFLVIYRVCCCYLTKRIALLVAAAAFLGSALISTMATALWSIDFAVLFVSLSLLILCKLAIGEKRPSYPYLLGFFLFGAYLCRPSTFLFVGLVLGYLLLFDRKTFWRTAVFAFVLLAGFLVFIRVGYGSWLPPYYNDFGRLAVERRPIYEAFFGNLVSPSRGLLIYSPIFFLTLVGAAYFFHSLKRKPLYWLMLSWFFLQLLLVARTTRWWGGLSFGPRILVELLPGSVLLTAMVCQAFWEKSSGHRLRIVVTSLFGVLGVWAVFLNSYQGLFNQYTAWWHSALTPNIDYEPDYLWNWEYPQFLADNDSLCRRDREYIEAALEREALVRHLYPYEPGRPLSIVPDNPFLIYELLAGEGETAADSQSGTGVGSPTAAATRAAAYLPLLLHEGTNNLDVLLSGWSNPQFGYRWSTCETVTIAFKLHSGVEPNRPYSLSFQTGSFGRQRLGITLNGVELTELEFDGAVQPPISKNITIPSGILLPGKVNQIALELPDSVIPDLPDENRRIALSFVSLTIQSFP